MNGEIAALLVGASTALISVALGAFIMWVSSRLTERDES